MLKGDKDGIAPVIEYIFAFTVFILVTSIYFTAVSTLFDSSSGETTGVEDKCISVSESLVSNTGMVSNMNKPHMKTRNWEYIPGVHINNENVYYMESLGLCRDNRSYGVLSYDKIIALVDVLDIQIIKDTLGLKNNMEINITITSVNNDIIDLSCGASQTESSKNTVTIHRSAVVINDKARIICDIGVTLFYGGSNL